LSQEVAVGKNGTALVTTSDMMDQAYTRSLLDELSPKNDVSLLIVGYQSEGTPGRKIEEGAR